MNEILTILIKAIISIAVTAITIYLVPFLKTVFERLKDDQIKKIILDAVWAAQQTITDNAEKKQYVLKLVSDWLARNKVTISPEELDALIESTVLEMKVETK